MVEPKIKFCGIREQTDLVHAIHLKVDFVGFIFHPPSPRFITCQDVKLLIDSTQFYTTRKVGVVVNLPLEEVAHLVSTLRLEVIQLHGDENHEYISKLQKTFPDLLIWKAIRVGDMRYDQPIALPTLPIEHFLLDKFAKNQYGGTGKTIPLDLVEKYCTLQSKDVKIIVAGGINTDNISDILDLSKRNISPWAIDINSGVEDAPGKKNHKLMSKMVALIKQ